MLLITNNADFYRMDSEVGTLLFSFNRHEIADYSEIVKKLTPVTEDEAAILISTGTPLQATSNSILPIKNAVDCDLPGKQVVTKIEGAQHEPA